MVATAGRVGVEVASGLWYGAANHPIAHNTISSPTRFILMLKMSIVLRNEKVKGPPGQHIRLTLEAGELEL